MVQCTIKTYQGYNAKASAEAFDVDASLMAREGYRPISQSWSPAAWGMMNVFIALLLCLVFIGFPMLVRMFIDRPGGVLTVCYCKD